MEKQYFEILLEEIKGNVQLVLEGHGLLVDRMDRIESRLDSMAADIKETKNNVGFLLSKDDKQDTRLDKIEHILGKNKIH
jgi:hypothetical protein